MDILCIDKCRYEIQEQKEVPLWYTGIYQFISSTDIMSFFHECDPKRLLRNSVF
jgi:hypothetical protein